MRRRVLQGSRALVGAAPSPPPARVVFEYSNIMFLGMDRRVQTTLFSTPPPCARLPRLGQRSHEELVFSAHVLDALGELSLPALAECLCLGDDAGQLDAMFGAIDVALEWDGGGERFHGEGSMARDVAKTERLLAQSATVRVVRMRVGAPPIPALDGRERCAVVCVPANATMLHALRAFAAAVRPFVAEPYKARLANLHGHKRPRAALEVHHLECACDAQFARGVRRLRGLLGDDAAYHVVSRVHGVRANTVAVADGLATLRDAVPEAASVATDPAAERHFVTKRAVAAVHLRATVRDHPFFFLGPCKGFA